MEGKLKKRNFIHRHTVLRADYEGDIVKNLTKYELGSGETYYTVSAGNEESSFVHEYVSLEAAENEYFLPYEALKKYISLT